MKICLCFVPRELRALLPTLSSFLCLGARGENQVSHASDFLLRFVRYVTLRFVAIANKKPNPLTKNEKEKNRN